MGPEKGVEILWENLCRKLETMVFTSKDCMFTFIACLGLGLWDHLPNLFLWE